MDKMKRRSQEKEHVNTELHESTVCRWEKLVSSKRKTWAELTPEILYMIFRKMNIIDVLTKAMTTCRNWLDLARNEPQLWTKVCITSRNNKFGPNYLEDMACVAINWSAGQLEEFRVEEFGSDALVQHVANSTSNLKHLSLINCEDYISEKSLRKAIKGWPLLEEIEITRFWCSPKLCITIGESCPNLKYFRFNRIAYHLRDYKFPDMKNQIAICIGGTMHNLRSLELIGNSMTEKGLYAILGGCPKLESLDIRDCGRLTINQSIQSMLARVKSMRYPGEPLRDHQFARHVLSRYCDTGITYPGIYL